MVTIGCVGEQVEIEVRDDGCGGADPAGGSGLRGLVDRLGALRGHLHVESPAGGGTTVRAIVPLDPHDPRSSLACELGTRAACLLRSLNKGLVVLSVNVSVLLYVPVRSGSWRRSTA